MTIVIRSPLDRVRLNEMLADGGKSAAARARQEAAELRTAQLTATAERKTATTAAPRKGRYVNHNSDRWKLALHEAGHCLGVALHARPGRDIITVEIFDAETDGCRGRVRLRDGAIGPLSLERVAMMSAASLDAFDFPPMWGFGSDLRELSCTMQPLARTGSQLHLSGAAQSLFADCQREAKKHRAFLFDLATQLCRFGALTRAEVVSTWQAHVATLAARGIFV